ncbi:M14 family zinc carboxypeptidase [Tahibacter amnicola]|uniref:M14 family zinc carboxypeptidase n=1 Tax=Tahibacter amnicola TaxID=2976241 RepID=A0ABY6BAM5_9GAMM|nr:M14 family zinc carboxypeptidase [Tahibacter amnicola]UXI67113.1 M14 family zinc carboxypeptidase [Tahibacter amnicola]
MLSLAVATVLAGLAAVPSVRAEEPARREIVIVRYGDAAKIPQLAERFSHMRVDRKKGVIVVDASADDIAWMRSLDMRVDVDKVATEQLDRIQSGVSLKSIPNFSCYRTVEETQASLDAMVTTFPTLASKIDIGDSWEKVSPAGNAGYDLNVLKLTNSANTAPKPKFFIMTAIHAREYTTAELNTRFAEWLLNGYGKDADATWLLDNNEFHLLLHTNPDGRKYAEAGQMWRKNTNTAYCGATSSSRGADLNRNYPFHWGGAGASTDQCSETYRGPTPGSEPETQAVTNYIQTIFPDNRPDDTTTAAPDTTQGLFFDIHSFSQLVLWPWGDVTAVAPNGPAMEILGRRLAYFNNYDPQQSVGLYPTTGATDDHAYGTLGVPAYTIELGTAFFENCNSFDNTTLPINLKALQYAARTLQAPYKLPYGPDVTQLTATPDLAVAGDVVQIRATLDDAAFNRTPQPQAGAPPVPTTQNVTGGTVYVDILPWANGATGQAMSAVDGGFNSGTEQASLALSTAGMASGKHLVYVQGTDTAGSKGPPRAAFVEVVQANEIATLHGSVRNAQNQQPLAATLEIGTTTFNADANGAYSRRLRAGMVDIAVSAPGFMTERVSDVNLAGGADVTRDFQLSPACVVFQDNAEGTNPGWTAQSPWGVANNVSGNATKVWTDSPAGNYADDLNISLTSPVINLTNYEDVTLRFDQKCSTESGWDFGNVEYALDGNSANPTWNLLQQCSGNTSWQNVAISLPQATNQAALRLRFRLTTDGNTTQEGWSIDNVRVEAGGIACRGNPDVLFRNGFE